MKLGSFVVLFLIMIMFLEFTGVETIAGRTLDNFGIGIDSTDGTLTSADIETPTFWGKIFRSDIGILIALSVGGAIIIGLFAVSKDTIFIVLPLLTFIGTVFSSVAWDLIKFMKDSEQAWATNITVIIMAGLGVAFIMSIVDYFTNR